MTEFTPTNEDLYRDLIRQDVKTLIQLEVHIENILKKHLIIKSKNTSFYKYFSRFLSIVKQTIKEKGI